MNKFFRNIHLWLSIPFGIIITVLCLTGAALVFESEITAALNPHLYRSEYREGTFSLKPSELAERIKGQVADTLQLSSLQLSSNPEGVCMASFKNAGRRTLSVDPYTGQVNGWIEGNSFFQTMRKLHRWLMDVPPKKGDKTFGKAVVGVSTLVLVVVLISGLVIWIPRKRKALKHRLKVSCTKGWRRFWYDSHVALGFYATLFLLLMALTGPTWSFSWYRTAAYSLFGGAPRSGSGQQQQSSHNSKKEDGHKQKDAFDYAVWDNVMATLSASCPEYNSIKLEMKTAQIVTSREGSLRKTDNATFDPATGELKEVIKYSDVPQDRKMKGLFYAFHAGTWGGMCTKILYFIAALIGGTLPLTGYYLWLKKKKKGFNHR